MRYYEIENEMYRIIIPVSQLKPLMHLQLYVLNWALCLKLTNTRKK